jgi:hypothetical protein
MYRVASGLLIIASSFAVAAQSIGTTVSLAPQTTLPIVFTSTVSARKAHNGDAIHAKTFQAVLLANGTAIPSGARVVGHVIEATPFVHDKTPYARQKDSTLTIHFDSIEANGAKLPLNVTVRALADYFATNAAREPKSTDLDSLGTLTLVGGDLLTPSQNEVRDQKNDVVGYNRLGGVYAHLIANGRCDGSSMEVSMGIYSASACGLYGYINTIATEFGSAVAPSNLTLVSHRRSPEIVKQSTALLEVLPEEHASVER